MTQSQVETGHADMIHDAQLDYYGRRLATASSDRTIRLFEAVDGKEADDWRPVDTLSGHEGPIHALSWAHPSFGVILASCSFDGKVFIWKENDGGKGWTKIKEHTLHNASVNAIAWAPHELGPVLACASSDGKVSVLTFNSKSNDHFTLIHSHQSDHLPQLHFADDGTWDASLFPAHSLGVTSVTWSPAVSSGSLSSPEGAGAPLPSRRFATGGCDGNVKVWGWNDQTKSWAPDAAQPVLEGHTDWVRDVAWAPSVGVGRGYLASAGQDKTVFLWTQDSPQAGWSRSALPVFGDVVWRVSWSVAGNVLAVSSGDGKVTLWKENLKGEFEEVSELTS